MATRRERREALHRERVARVWGALVRRAIAEETVVYECLGCETNVTVAPLSWGDTSVLATIHEYCDSEGLPPLNVLAVNMDTGRPGPGFFRRSNDAAGDTRRVFEMGRDWQDVTPPVR